MVETSIITTLREVILRDVVELQPDTIVAIALFVITLGLLRRVGDLRMRRLGGRRADGWKAAQAESLQRHPPVDSPASPEASSR